MGSDRCRGSSSAVWGLSGGSDSARSASNRRTERAKQVRLHLLETVIGFIGWTPLFDAKRSAESDPVLPLVLANVGPARRAPLLDDLCDDTRIVN